MAKEKRKRGLGPAVTVKRGSPCIVRYQKGLYYGVIQEVRGNSKRLRISFMVDGKLKEVWRNTRDVGPASPFQQDVVATVAKKVEDKEWSQMMTEPVAVLRELGPSLRPPSSPK